MTLGISRSVAAFAVPLPVDALGITLGIPQQGVDQPRNVRGCDLRWSTGPRGRSKKVDHPTHNALTCATLSLIYTETHGGPEVVHALPRFAGPPSPQALKNQGQSGPVQVVPTYVGRALVDRPDYVRAVAAGPGTTERHHGAHAS